MTFGLTPFGFNAKRLADIKNDLENAFIAQFGEINLDPQSVFGQTIGVMAKTIADIWENLEDIYFSQYPNSASGTSLDNVVQLNGITRLPATQTSVIATCAGNEGTFIPINSIASIPSTNNSFYANIGGLISRVNAVIFSVNVMAVAAQSYTVLMNNQGFTYSLPIITFSNTGPIFVSSNSIVISINGVALTAVPYNTSSNQTLADIATAISAFDSSLACVATATNPNIIKIVPNSGYSITINYIQVTGGSTQATNVITYDTPANQNAITAALAALINVGTPPWTCVNNMDGTITVTSSTPSLPINTNVGTNLEISYVASPINFLSVDYGPIPCPVNTLTNIVTPIAGWSTVTNSVAGVTGTLIETDAQLRIRRLNSIQLLGNATVEAIRAKLLQQVVGVTSATVFENRTLTQQPIQVIFPGQFNSGDTITVTYDTVNNFTVPFNTNQATTMADLVTAFEALPAVLSASYGGSGNQTVTILMKILQVLVVNSATTDVSSMTAKILGGRPPKSFEAIVQGGSDAAVAMQIWLTKPAGIETYGNTSYTIVDSQGDNQVIFFSRPTLLYIWVEVALTLYTEEMFPVNGITLVAQNINSYINSLGVGIDVLFQRVLAQIFTVTGIASGNMQIAATALPSDSPSFGTSDIAIDDTELSISNLNLITVTVV